MNYPVIFFLCERSKSDSSHPSEVLVAILRCHSIRMSSPDRRVLDKNEFLQQARDMGLLELHFGSDDELQSKNRLFVGHHPSGLYSDNRAGSREPRRPHAI